MKNCSYKQMPSIQRTRPTPTPGLTDLPTQAVQRLCELNLQTVRLTLAGWYDGIFAALAMREQTDLTAWQAWTIEASSLNVCSYGRQLNAIVTETQMRFWKAAQIQRDIYDREAQRQIDNVWQSTLDGSRSDTDNPSGVTNAPDTLL